ncbi:MAG: ArsR/SmtB family transcription factor [Acidimicrobiales bacterium]
MSVRAPSAPLACVSALADPLRHRIVEALAGEELCVCHLVEPLDATQPLVSHHLKALREAGLVESDRHRYWTDYRLRPERLAWLGAALAEPAAQAPIPGARRRPCC